MSSEKELNKMKKEMEQLVSFCGKLDTQLGNLPSNIDNWSIKLTYLSANRLLKHSKALNRWTIVIAVFTVVLGLSTIWSIIDKCLL